MKRTVLEKRAVRTGIKASKKRGHVVSLDELLDLRVQTLPALFRIVLLLVGTVLLVAAYFAWPSLSSNVRGLEAVSGIFAILFGAFGVRRTLSNLIDSMNVVDVVDFGGSMVELIANALSEIDL